MIKINIRYSSTGEFLQLETIGHANSAPLGEDLICASVSGIILGGINALKGKNYTFKCDEITGEIKLCNIGKMDEHDKIVIETIVTQIQAVCRDNPKFVKLSVN